MIDWQVNYSILTCFDRTIFLYRPEVRSSKSDKVNTLYISDEYRLHPDGSNEKPKLTLLMVISWFLLACGYLGEAEKPVPKNGEVLVKVQLWD